MSLSIFEDDDLVASLGYSHTLDRGAHGMRWIRVNRREKNGARSTGLGLSARRSEHAEPRALRERMPHTIKTGRSKRLTPHEVLVVVESRFSLSHLAKAYGVTRAAIAYYRRAARQGGPSAIESARRAMRDDVQMRLAGVSP